MISRGRCCAAPKPEGSGCPHHYWVHSSRRRRRHVVMAWTATLPYNVAHAWMPHARLVAAYHSQHREPLCRCQRDCFHQAPPVSNATSPVEPGTWPHRRVPCRWEPSTSAPASACATGECASAVQRQPSSRKHFCRDSVHGMAGWQLSRASTARDILGLKRPQTQLASWEAQWVATNMSAVGCAASSGAAGRSHTASTSDSTWAAVAALHHTCVSRLAVCSWDAAARSMTLNTECRWCFVTG